MVFGSVPPDARDVDVVGRAAAIARIRTALEREGFTACRRRFAHLTDPSLAPVELVDVQQWGLPADERDRLFEEAEPIDGCRHLATPSPRHAVLLLARRNIERGGLDERRRARLPRGSGATDAARAAEGAWGLTGAVDLLDRPPGPRARARILAARAGGGPQAVARAWRAVVRSKRKRGAVIALSGLDGSGKTTQAKLLTATLDRNGIESVTEWSRLSFDPVLLRISTPIKRALRLVAGRGGRAAEPNDEKRSATAGTTEDPARELRRRSALLTHAWTMVVVTANLRSHRRATVAHLRAGRVVVCDRYVLDSAAHLRVKYGEQRRFPVQTWLLRRFSPAPAAAFFLDVPPDVAYGRKQERFDVDALARHAALYRACAGELGVTILDGTRPLEDLASEIATVAWRATC